MSYVVINGESEHYNEIISPFTTQHGKAGVKFIGDAIPTTDKGFMFYDDNDQLLADLSDYIYEYKPNCYSVEEDIIDSPTGTDAPIPPSSYDKLNRKINRVSSQVNSITPFEKTKKAYYGEIEKVFYDIPEGNTTIFFDNYTGDYIIERVENRLIVTFPERLKDMTNITIMVNK